MSALACIQEIGAALQHLEGRSSFAHNLGSLPRELADLAVAQRLECVSSSLAAISNNTSSRLLAVFREFCQNVDIGQHPRHHTERHLLLYNNIPAKPLLRALKHIASLCHLESFEDESGHVLTVAGNTIVLDITLTADSLTKVHFVYGPQAVEQPAVAQMLFRLLQLDNLHHFSLALYELSLLDQKLHADPAKDPFKVMQELCNQYSENRSSSLPLSLVNQQLPYLAFLLDGPVVLCERHATSQLPMDELLQSNDTVQAYLRYDGRPDRPLSLILRPSLMITATTGRDLENLLGLEPATDVSSIQDNAHSVAWLEDLLADREPGDFDEYRHSFADGNCIDQVYTLASQQSIQGFVVDQIALQNAEQIQPVLEILTRQCRFNRLFKSVFAEQNRVVGSGIVDVFAPPPPADDAKVKTKTLPIKVTLSSPMGIQLSFPLPSKSAHKSHQVDITVDQSGDRTIQLTSVPEILIDLDRLHQVSRYLSIPALIRWLQINVD